MKRARLSLAEPEMEITTFNDALERRRDVR